MNRRTHNNHSSSKTQARIARVKDKLAKLRASVRRSTAQFWERRQARVAWWQLAFRTPMSGGRWIFSQAKSLWAAFMTLLGLQPRRSALMPRASSIKASKSYRKSYSRNMLFAEGLEPRQLLAADLSLLDLQTSSDVGVSNTDNITSIAAPTFDVSYDTTGSGADNVQLRLGSTSGTLLGFAAVPGGATGVVSITTSALADGFQTIVAVPASGVGQTTSLGVTIDTTPATVVITSSDGTGPDTINASETATLTFTFDSEPDGFTAGDVTFNNGGSIGPLTTVNPTTFSAVYTPPAAFDGTDTVSIAAASFKDAAGNDNLASSLALDIDTIPPTVAITRGGAGVINSTGTETLTFTFSEAPGASFDVGDVTFTGGGAITTPVGGPTVFTATYTPPINFTGTDTVTIAASKFLDVSGNDNVAPATLALPIDTVPPTVAITRGGAGVINSTGTETLTFTFSEAPGASFVSGDVSFTGGGSITTPIGGPTVFTATYTPPGGFTGTDTVTIAAAKFMDAAGNDNVAPATLALPIDTVAPTVTINQAVGQADPTSVLPIKFDVVFSEPVTGFTAGDVALSGSASFSSTSVSVSGSGTTYTVFVNGTLTGPGTVIATVPVSPTTKDSAGNSNLASTSTDNTVTVGGRSVSIVATDSHPVENQINNAQFTVSIDTSSTSATTVVFMIDPTSTAELGADPKDFVFNPSQVTVISAPSVYSATKDVYSVVIPAHATSTVIDIDLQDDLNYDPNETIKLTLLDAINGADLVEVGSPASDFMTIIDNETGATVSVTKNSTGNAREGDPTTTVNGQFKISLSTPLDTEATVVLNIGTGGAGVAVNTVDYNFSGATLVGSTATDVTVKIPAYTSSVLLDIIPISESATVELDETVTLTPASIALASPPTATGTVVLGSGASLIIEDDDSALVNAGGDQTVVESGADGAVTFNMTKSNQTGTMVASTDTIVNFSTVENADLNYGVDYVVYSNIDNGPVSESESNNTIGTAVSLDGADWNIAPNATIGGSATSVPHITITGNDDGGGDVDYYKFTLLEPGTVKLTYGGVGTGTISLRNSSDSLVMSGFGTTATLAAGTYFVRAVPSSSPYVVHISAENVLNAAPTKAVIYAGDSSGAMKFNPVDENLVNVLLENDEAVTYTITSLVGDAQIARDTDNSTGNQPDHIVTVKITDDDSATVSLVGTGVTGGINNAQANNGIEVGTNGQFTVTMTNRSDQATTVPFKINFTGPLNSTVSGDAVYGVDYKFDGAEVIGDGTSTNPFRVTIPANSLSTSFKIVVLDEAGLQDVEADEKVVLELLDNSTPSTGPFAGINAIYGPYGFPTGDPNITIGTASDWILIKDTDLAVVTVNSTIDTAVEDGSNGEWTIQLSERNLAFPLVATPVIPLNPYISSVDTVVTYAITFGTASPGDLKAPTPALTGSVTIPAGQPSVTIPLSAFDDGLSEGTETVYLTVLSVTSGDSDVKVADPSTDANDDTIFIQDANVTKVAISPVTTSQIEGDSPTTTVVNFTASLTGDALASTSDVIIVNYTVTGSATAGLDYSIPGGDITAPITGSVTIDPNVSTSALIKVTVIGDSIVELNETVIITITSISYGGPATIQIDNANKVGTLTITDDDSADVWIDATDQSAGEGTNNGEFTVYLSNPSSTGVLVSYSIITPTPPFSTPHATEGSDYVDLDGAVVGGGTIFIGPNLTSATIPIVIKDDAILEGNERVVIQLTGTGNPQFTITGTDGPVDVGDPAPVGNRDYVLISPDQTVKVTKTSSLPAQEGVVARSFTISMTRPSTTAVNVTYTLSGPAVEGTDYAGITHTATILAGDTFTTVSIDPTIVGDDAILENPEDVVITLTGVSNVAPDASADITVSSVAGDETATLSIVDNDYAYVTIAGNTGGNETGPVDGQFTVTLRDGTGAPTTATEDVVVSYSVGGSASSASGDFAALSGTVTILAGSSTATIDVDVNDDSFVEGTENVTVSMTGVTSALLPLPSAPSIPRVFLGALGGPTLTFQQDVAAFAGFGTYTGTSDTFVREADSLVNYGGSVSVELDDVAPGAEHGLVRFENIFGVGFGQIPIFSAIDSASLIVRTPASGGGPVDLYDMLVGWNENSITWANATLGNALPGIQHDGSEAAAVGSSQFLNSGASTSLDVTSSVAAWSVGSTNNGWAIFADGGLSEFASSEFGTSTFRPKLSVTVSTSATIQILDNDSVTVSIDSWTPAMEETTPGVVTVKMTGAALDVGNVITVPYFVGGSGAGFGSATGASDYVISSGYVTFTSTSNTDTFNVNVLPDTLIEGTENVKVWLGTPTVSGPNAAAISALTTVGTGSDFVDILDDDSAVLTAGLKPGVDGSEKPAEATLTSPHLFTKPVFRVTQGYSSTVNTVINYTLTGTATGGGVDYNGPSSGTLTIPAGATFADLTVDLIDDDLNESDETIIFTIVGPIVSGNPGITVGTGGSNIATDIIEDDDALTAKIDTSANPTASEAPAVGDNTGTYVISLNKASDKSTTIPFEVTGGSAALPTTIPVTGPDAGKPSGPDYTLTGGANVTWLSPTKGYVTFPASASPQSTTITLTAKQDFDPTEGAETAIIEIKNSVTVGATTKTLSNANTPPHPTIGIAGSPATVTINDEEYVVSIAKTDSPAKEDGLALGGFNGQFTVSISNPTQPGNPVTVPFSIDNSDLASIGIAKATYGVDYILTGPGVTITSAINVNPITGTVVIPGGASTALITVEVKPDSIVEGYPSPATTDDFLFEDVDITIGTPTSLGSIATLTTVPADKTATEHIIDNDEAKVTVIPVVNQDLDGALTGDAPGLKEDSNDGGFEFKLSKAAQGRDVKVEFKVLSSSTATGGGVDYNFGSGVNGVFGTGFVGDPFYVIIPAGSQSTIAVIEVVTDTLVEGPEDINIEITAVKEVLQGTSTPADIPDISLGGPFTATATIEDNDSAFVTIVANDADAREPSNIGQFTISLSKPVPVPVTVTYTVSGDASPDNDANPNDDYVALPGTYTFAANQTTAVINVNTLDDDLVEDDEKVIVTINAMTGLVTAAGTETATVIIASEDRVTATLTAPTNANEQGETDGVFKVTLDKMADEPITFTLIDQTVAGLGKATTPGDYSLDAPMTITVPAFSLTGTLNVSPVDDGLAEGPETLTYKLGAVTSPVPYTSTIVSANPLIILNPASATMTIIDNDVPVFSVDDVTVTEGVVGDGNPFLSGTTTMTFTVSHTGTLAPGETVSITPVLTSLTATLGSDFAMGPTTLPLVFTAAGPSSQTFTVLVNHDDMQEADETFKVSLTAVPTGPLVVDATDTAIGKILNDDFAVYTAVQTGVVSEGSTASPYGELSTFQILSFDITPNIPVDKSIQLRVDYNDGVGATGAKGANFDALIPPGTPITSLPFGTDFDNSRDTVDWTPAQALAKTTKTVTVKVVQDNIVEGGSGTVTGFGSETFTTNMSLLPADATARPGITFVNGTGEITDDDGTSQPFTAGTGAGGAAVPANVTVFATDPDASEPGVGFGDGLFTFSVDTPVQQDLIINYTFTVDGAVGDPDGDIDSSTPIGNPTTGVGQITIPGSVTSSNTSITLPLKAFDDIVLENDEFVAITITGVSTDANVTYSNGAASTQRVKIHDNDTATLSITATDPIATEGSATDTATFTISLSKVSDTPTSVNLMVKPSTGGGLLSSPTLTSSDYSGLPLTVTIPPNTLSTTVTITALQDSIPEGPEDLAVKLVTPILGNADISIGATNEAKVTILDDGDGLTVNVITDRHGNEPGTAGADEGQVKVELRDAFGALAVLPVGSTSTGFLTVAYTTADITATQGIDYNAPVGLLKINEGSSSGLLSIDVTDDLLVEGTESLSFTITGIFDGFNPITVLPSGPSAGEPIALGTSATTVNIIDNDKATFTIDDLAVNEGAGTATLQVKLDNAIAASAGNINVTLNFLDSGNSAFTATLGSDFTLPASTTLTFNAANPLTQTFTVNIIDDSDIEGFEAFGVTMTASSAVAGVMINDSDNASVTIIDNDTLPTLRVSEVQVSSTGWAPDFKDAADGVAIGSGLGKGYSIPTGAAQTKVLPWSNINRLRVLFTEPVDLSTVVASGPSANVILHGTVNTGSAPTITAASIDTDGALVLSLSGAIPTANLRLEIKDSVKSLAGVALDGEFITGGSLPSGNLTAGAPFNFRFTVNPGDANQNGVVNGSDAGLAYFAFGKQPGQSLYSIFIDINGNAVINGSDAGISYFNFGATPPVALPGSVAAPPVTSSLSAIDSAFSQLDEDDEDLLVDGIVDELVNF